MLKVKKQIHKKIINNDQNAQIKNQNDLKKLNKKFIYRKSKKAKNHR